MNVLVLAADPEVAVSRFLDERRERLQQGAAIRFRKHPDGAEHFRVRHARDAVSAYQAHVENGIIPDGESFQEGVKGVGLLPEL